MNAWKYSRTTKCFSRISFNSKFKESSWRSRTSGNLMWSQQNYLWLLLAVRYFESS